MCVWNALIKSKKQVSLIVTSLVLLQGCAWIEANSRVWQSQLDTEIKALGYKNWIVIADASFPLYNRAGVRTLTAAAETPDVLDEVVKSIDRVQHVKPQFYTSRELRNVTNVQAPGISDFRQELDESFHGFEPRELDNATLMRLLDSTSSSFAILVIKTSTSLPYSSVFVELDSGYWDGDLERDLRGKMDRKSKVDRSPQSRETVNVQDSLSAPSFAVTEKIRHRVLNAF